MLDGVTLDQLRTFIAAVDQGELLGRRAQAAPRAIRGEPDAGESGGAARRAAVRSVRALSASLTDEGRSLLVDAHSVADAIDGFKARARAMREGLEPELSASIDVMYPMERLTKAASHSRTTYPHTALRLYVEALGAVIKPVLDGTCHIGVIGSLPLVPDELQEEPLLDVPFVTVVSATHPLAAKRGTVSKAASPATRAAACSPTGQRCRKAASTPCCSALTWRLADLGAKHAFLREGLGWGHMPLAHRASRSRRRHAREDPRRRRPARAR